MFLWSSFVELLRVALFAFAHVCGGSLGGGIIALSLMIRLALLPLTLRIALRAHAHQRLMQTLKPEIDRLQRRHANNPLALARSTRALHARHGVEFPPRGTFLGALVQMPIGGAVYQTVASAARHAARFLWVRDLSRPDALVASIAAGLAGAAVMAGPASPTSRTTAGLAAVATFLLAWRLSAGVGLYWVASNTVGVVQSLLVRRAASRGAT